MRTILAVAHIVLGLFAALPAAVPGQQAEDAIVKSATAVLRETMTDPDKQIPQSLLANIQGLAIVPGMIKGGFVVGVERGRGVAVVRDETGNWHAPAFITMTGGSIGFQAGVQAIDVVLVFKTQKSVQGLLRGKFTIGADVAAAAGPVGRTAGAATDATLGAEIYSYSRSRGLFVGAALDGTSVQVDANANTVYYQANPQPAPNVPPGEPAPLPLAASELLAEIAKYTTPAPAASPVAAAPAMVPLAAPAQPGLPAASEAETVRRQLADASRPLFALLSGQWRQYLALPVEVFGVGHEPTEQALAQTLGAYDTVARNPQYQALVQRPEFQTTYQLLRKLLAIQEASGTTSLQLPPPPQ